MTLEVLLAPLPFLPLNHKQESKHFQPIPFWFNQQNLIRLPEDEETPLVINIMPAIDVVVAIAVLFDCVKLVANAIADICVHLFNKAAFTSLKRASINTITEANDAIATQE